jgi:hypothetical protein
MFSEIGLRMGGPLLLADVLFDETCKYIVLVIDLEPRSKPRHDLHESRAISARARTNCRE